MFSLRPKGSSAADAREAEEVRIGYRMLGLGFQVVSEVGAGLLLGWIVKWATGWTWAIAVGGLVGIVVGLSTMVRTAWKLNAGLEGSGRKGRPTSRGGSA